MPKFDPKTEAADLKSQTKSIRKRTYFQRKSRLDKFKFELLELKNAGCKISELQRFLKSKRINVAHSTVSRWVKNNE